MSIRIEYGGVAVGAKRDFLATTDNKAPFVDLLDLNQSGAEIKNFGNPYEAYTVPLDGGTLALPNEHNGDNIGWWSNEVSDASGVFGPALNLTLLSNEYYTSSGLTFIFDTFNNIYPKAMRIEWYTDDTLISEKEFFPTSPNYFCQNKVEYYNKVIIVILSINMPNTRLRLRSIDYGSNVTFTGRELRDARMIQEINPLSLELPINTLDIIIYGKQADNLAFEENQPLVVYFNEKLKGKMFVQSAQQLAAGQWKIAAEDYIGVLEDTPFPGGIYKYKPTFDVLDDIFKTANVPYHIDENLQEYFVSGYIPYTTCRMALMQLLFAMGAVADTSNSEVVEIFEISNQSSQTVPLTRIMQGQKIKNDVKVSAVELTAHDYAPSDDMMIAYTSEYGGENVFITFTEPLHSLELTNGEILESGSNYAIINAEAGCELKGKKYIHTTVTKALHNPLSSKSDIGKVISVKNATLISQYNIDKILDLCYNYYRTSKRVFLKIAETRQTPQNTFVSYGEMAYGAFVYGGVRSTSTLIGSTVGDTIEAETPYGYNIKGVIERQAFKLVGNLLIKDSVLKEVN
jgi:hypothetical protein